MSAMPNPSRCRPTIKQHYHPDGVANFYPIPGCKGKILYPLSGEGGP